MPRMVEAAAEGGAVVPAPGLSSRVLLIVKFSWYGGFRPMICNPKPFSTCSW